MRELESRFDLQCPICQKGIDNWRIKKTKVGSFNIDRCVNCGYAFVNPRPNIEYLMNYYSKLGHGEEEMAEEILDREAKEPNSTIRCEENN